MKLFRSDGSLMKLLKSFLNETVENFMVAT